MLEFLSEMLSFPFMVRALAAGSLIALCAALLGVSLVLKRYSMIGDGLSHVGFGALAAAAVLNIAPLPLAIPVVILTAFLLLRLNRHAKMRGDAAIAVISTASLAIGVMLLSLRGGVNTDVYNYMFGSIYAMSDSDLKLSIVLCVAVLVLFVLFYNRLFAVTFDEEFACAGGIRVNLYNMLIAALAAVTIVIGMRMMGAMLISALIIFPPLSAMRLCKTFRSVAVTSATLAFVGFVLGITVSYCFDTPGGASVVVVYLLLMLLFSVVATVKGRVRRKHSTEKTSS